jgi:cold shock CspA family protein
MTGMDENKVGTVVTWDVVRGFGFVACAGEPDYYLHISDIENRITPSQGQKVRFKDGGSSSGRRNKAVEVKFYNVNGRQQDDGNSDSTN